MHQSAGMIPLDAVTVMTYWPLVPAAGVPLTFPFAGHSCKALAQWQAQCDQVRSR